MSIKIALAGNPNCGKTTLFNALTGSNQFVGNWPGVTVEKKEGKLKEHRDVTIVDLPGIYSLSPYTLEEVVARNYLITERPDVILNIIDGTNLERNLYLTTQLAELGIPMIAAVNMMDVVERDGDRIHVKSLKKALGCEVYEISALKGSGVMEAANACVRLAESGEKTMPQHSFCGSVEHALAHIEEYALHDRSQEEQRWYAIKLFERDEKIIEQLGLDEEKISHIEQDITDCERELDDDAESIITGERYSYIDSVIRGCYEKKRKGRASVSDQIDRIVTNRFLALPFFALVMVIVYYVSVTSVGSVATDWANDGVFGDGWHLFGIGSAAYEEAAEEYEDARQKTEAYLAAAEEAGIDVAAMTAALDAGESELYETLARQIAGAGEAASVVGTAQVLDDNGEVEETFPVFAQDFLEAVKAEEPEAAGYGVWIPGIPVLAEGVLETLGTAKWLNSLILDGIIGGVGAVLGFVPQILVLFLFLAFLEACGYMARIAFIMDRIFRRFGLSGKSFIPMLIGTGCGVPGIMASRTIENDRDRKMTILTTTFIPCSAKLPIIALIAGAMFGGAWWVSPSAYFLGIAAIIVSGIILKKTKMFAGDPAPFVMELPAYRLPAAGNILRSMWERGCSFIKKAGTIILLSSIVLWFLQGFGWEDGGFCMVENLNNSVLARIGGMVAPLFAPLGWGDWKAAVAAVTGLVAKENVVNTFGVLYSGLDEVSENGWQIWANMRLEFTALSAYSFLAFNLLCAPCFAAMGAIKREMNSAKWTWFAIGYQTLFAYAVSLCIYQIGTLLSGGGFGIATAAAMAVMAAFLYLLFRPDRKSRPLKKPVAA